MSPEGKTRGNHEDSKARRGREEIIFRLRVLVPSWSFWRSQELRVPPPEHGRGSNRAKPHGQEDATGFIPVECHHPPRKHRTKSRMPPGLSGRETHLPP